MTELSDAIANLEKEVYSLTKENEIQNRVFSKFEETIEKLQVLTETLHRLIILHEERIKVTSDSVESLRKEMRDEIKELEDRLSHETSNLSEKIDKSEGRILEKLAELKKEWNQEQERVATAETNAQKKVTLNDRINSLTGNMNKWIYFVIGGVFVFGWMSGKANFFSSIISFLFKQ